MKIKKTLLSAVLLLTVTYGCTTANINKEENKNMAIIAHRGGAGLAPENTLLAMDKGIEAGADFLEIDIHQTNDNQLVVCHDRTIDRTTNGKGRISEMSLEEIRSYNIVDEDDKLTDLKIPTLDEVLTLVKGKSKLLIEIKKKKDLYPDIERLLLEAMGRYMAWDWIVVQSFNDEVLEKIHYMNPSVRLEKLLFFRVTSKMIFDGGLTKFDAENYYYVASFNVWKGGLTRGFEKEVREWNKEIKVWCVDSPDDLSSKVHPDGIITNRPDLWKSHKKQ